jgi:uncharacterized protein (TIGR02231 family)
MVLSTLILGASLALPAAAAPINADSHIDAVTVFRYQALVVRRAEVVLPGTGTQFRITVPGLPPTLDESSVQARCTGSGSPAITGVTLESSFSEEVSNAEAKQLEAELLALQDQDRVFLDAKKALEERRTFLVSLRNSYVQRVAIEESKIDLKQWAEAQALVAKGLETIASEERTLSQERRALAKKIAAARRRAQEIASKRATAGRVAQIDVKARAGTATCQVRYLVPSVGWRSSYDARLDDGALQLTQQAVVTNRSGEDWNGVELSLSTADPVRAVAVPEIYPSVVRLYAVRGPDDWNGVPPASPRAEEGNIPRERSESDASKKQTLVDATFAQRELHAVYTAQTRATIPSTGAPRKVTIATHHVRPQLLYVAAPRVAEGAYLTARAKNSGKLPILAGEVRLFLGDEFVGQTQVRTVVPGDEILFSFGKDERVRVERERLARNERQVGIFTKESEISERYRIRVHNYTGREIKLGLLDQVPISENEKVKVEIDSDSIPRTPPQPKDRPGTLRWNMTLQEGGNAEVTFGYAVRFPLGQRIAGI